MFIYFLVILVVLFIIGVPVAVSIGITPSLILYFMDTGLNLSNAIIAQRFINGVESFVILAIPLFLLVGKLMNVGGITDRIFNFARSMVGHLEGGLGHVNVVASLIFSGMTGTAASDAAGLGAVEIDAMDRAGYDLKMAVAITGASATVGPIIPPSLPIVIYGVLAGVSVGRLLIGGLMPGLLTGLLLMVMVFYFAKKHDYPKDPKSSWKVRGKAFIRSFPALLTPVILIGGIMWGAFTPTEASAVAVFYAMILGFMTKELNFKKLWEVLQEATVDSAVIGIIISSAAMYGWLMVRLGIPQELLSVITALSDNRLIILLILNIFFLFIGSFMETIAAITIFTPILVPVLIHFQIDPLHFGVVFIFNLMIGLLTPPFGINLFILGKVSGLSVEEIFPSVAKFLVVLLIVLLLITYIPSIVTWVPDTFM